MDGLATFIYHTNRSRKECPVNQREEGLEPDGRGC